MEQQRMQEYEDEKVYSYRQVYEDDEEFGL
jgi:hypothetical protein